MTITPGRPLGHAKACDIHYGTDSSMAGLLIFLGQNGTRHVVEIGGPAVPNYTNIGLLKL